MTAAVQPTTREVLDWCDAMIGRYVRDKRANLWKANLAQAIVLVATASVPVLLLMADAYKDTVEHWLWIPAVATAVATVAHGSLTAFRWQENWIRCGYAFHLLEEERRLFLAGAGQYAKLTDSVRTQAFADRIHHLVMEEVAGWRTQLDRRGEPGSPPGQ